MSWMDVLRQYRDATASPPPAAADDFQQVAREVPREELSAGLADAFRSEQTPPMESLIRQLYEHSNPDQRAGFLNHIRDALGPSALAMDGTSAADLLRRTARSGQQITTDDARNVAPQDVEELAQAARTNPNLLQRATQFYAQHPQVVQMLGQAVLGVALNAMAQRRRI